MKNIRLTIAATLLFTFAAVIMCDYAKIPSREETPEEFDARRHNWEEQLEHAANARADTLDIDECY